MVEYQVVEALMEVVPKLDVRVPHERELSETILSLLKEVVSLSKEVDTTTNERKEITLSSCSDMYHDCESSHKIHDDALEEDLVKKKKQQQEEVKKEDGTIVESKSESTETKEVEPKGLSDNQTNSEVPATTTTTVTSTEPTQTNAPNEEVATQSSSQEVDEEYLKAEIPKADEKFVKEFTMISSFDYYDSFSHYSPRNTIHNEMVGLLKKLFRNKWRGSKVKPSKRKMKLERLKDENNSEPNYDLDINIGELLFGEVPEEKQSNSPAPDVDVFIDSLFDPIVEEEKPKLESESLLVTAQTEEVEKEQDSVAPISIDLNVGPSQVVEPNQSQQPQEIETDPVVLSLQALSEPERRTVLEFQVTELIPQRHISIAKELIEKLLGLPLKELVSLIQDKNKMNPKLDSFAREINKEEDGGVDFLFGSPTDSELDETVSAKERDEKQETSAKVEEDTPAKEYNISKLNIIDVKQLVKYFFIPKDSNSVIDVPDELLGLLKLLSSNKTTAMNILHMFVAFIRCNFNASKISEEDRKLLFSNEFFQFNTEQLNPKMPQETEQLAFKLLKQFLQSKLYQKLVHENTFFEDKLHVLQIIMEYIENDKEEVFLNNALDVVYVILRSFERKYNDWTQKVKDVEDEKKSREKKKLAQEKRKRNKSSTSSQLDKKEEANKESEAQVNLEELTEEQQLELALQESLKYGNSQPDEESHQQKEEKSEQEEANNDKTVDVSIMEEQDGDVGSSSLVDGELNANRSENNSEEIHTESEEESETGTEGIAPAEDDTITVEDDMDGEGEEEEEIEEEEVEEEDPNQNDSADEEEEEIKEDEDELFDKDRDMEIETDDDDDKEEDEHFDIDGASDEELETKLKLYMEEKQNLINYVKGLLQDRIISCLIDKLINTSSNIMTKKLSCILKKVALVVESKVVNRMSTIVKKESQYISSNLNQMRKYLVQHQGEQNTPLSSEWLSRIRDVESERRFCKALSVYASIVKPTGLFGKKDGKLFAASETEDSAELLKEHSIDLLWESVERYIKLVAHKEEDWKHLEHTPRLILLVQGFCVFYGLFMESNSKSEPHQVADMKATPTPTSFSPLSKVELFMESNKKLINGLLKIHPPLFKSTLSMVLKYPEYIDFENKKSYFYANLIKKKNHENTLYMSFERQKVFEESVKNIMDNSPKQLKNPLDVSFEGEHAIDHGGVSREWFAVMCKEFFNSNLGLFVHTINQSTFQPNPLSNALQDHLRLFQACGRFIAMAVYHKQLLDCYFTRSFYKHMLGIPLSYKDMEGTDPEFYNNLKWVYENDIEENELDLCFTIEVEDMETKRRVVELKPNGSHTKVTNENKAEYVRLVTEFKMTKSIQEQVEAFLKGFFEIVSKELLSIFNEQELELLISGLPEIDIEDMKRNTEYSGYTPMSAQIRWFWNTVEQMTEEEKAQLLQFVTGTSKVPLDGFKALMGSGSIQKFNISKVTESTKLPSSHTCFNQLDLPEYSSEEELKEKLLIAVKYSYFGFGFA